ncbi:MAG: acyl-CoA reductase [Lachnospiraceae bacterium]|nr:acyl-CoA reductase [Lachnospiraceae bacterium]
MLLIHGEIIETNFEKKYLKSLYQDCLHTLNQNNSLTTEKVINACDALYKKVIKGDFNDIIEPLLKMSDISKEHFENMARLFTREELEYKCQIELGIKYPTKKSLKDGTRRELYPLGILFHIAAGNVDGLPAYSVIEGLLTGNINILKLPAGDNGLSIKLLWELIQLEPALKNYIYVFDVPSTDLDTLKVFAEIADGIIVWGGDEAVKAARNMADVTTKIISWGHKLSFAYVTPDVKDEDLYELALHVCETNQVFCSSCQGIFVDTEEEDILASIGARFFEQLKKANTFKGKTDMGMRGRNTIRLYKDMLEKDNQNQILSGEGVSVIVKSDRELELSYLFRNVWVKALPRAEIIQKLKKHKNHLQTCGLFCKEKDREELVMILAKAGVVRITGANMSRTIPGEAHDGTYPLQEYTRIVEY